MSRGVGVRVVQGMAGVVGVVLMAALLWLSRSTVVLTAGGVYDSIQLPVGSGAMRWRADQAVVAPSPQLEGLHGPVVRRIGTDGYEIGWYCRDRAERVRVDGDSVSMSCQSRSASWRWRRDDSLPVYSHPTVERIAVTSDLEGDTAYFGAWGRALGVLDSTGAWAFGTGHVVVLGDATDRGRWVYPLLWTLYRLDGEARAAGGRLHYVLGNHEQYNLVGITKDIETEHHYAMRQLGRYDRLLDTTTVLGQWLRTRPVALRVGRTLFVHGGISPDVLREQLTLDSLNVRSRDFLHGRDGVGRTREYQLGTASPTQYRGLVMGTAEAPRAAREHVDAALRHFDVERIVVGHTEVDSVSFLYDGRVIDVNATQQDPRALMLVDDTPQVRPVGVRRRAWQEPAATVRRFALLSRDDWRALLGVFGAAAR